MAARTPSSRSLRDIIGSTHRGVRYRYYWQGTARKSEVIDRCARCDLPFRRPGTDLSYGVLSLCPACARRAHDRLLLVVLLFLFVGGLSLSLAAV